MHYVVGVDVGRAQLQTASADRDRAGQIYATMRMLSRTAEGRVEQRDVLGALALVCSLREDRA